VIARPSMARQRRSTTASCAGHGAASGNLFRELAGKARSANMQMIDSTHIKAHRSAAGGNVWPAPSASGFLHWHKQSAQTYPAFRLRRWPRWRSARSDPHKGDGIEVPFSAVGLQNADRLSGHLLSTTRRHH